jgi:hypothetical protein
MGTLMQRQPAGVGHRAGGPAHLGFIVSPELGNRKESSGLEPHRRTPHRIAVAVGRTLQLHARELIERKLPHPPAGEAESHDPEAPAAEIELGLAAGVPGQPPQSSGRNPDAQPGAGQPLPRLKLGGIVRQAERKGETQKSPCQQEDTERPVGPDPVGQPDDTATPDDPQAPSVSGRRRILRASARAAKDGPLHGSLRQRLDARLRR